MRVYAINKENGNEVVGHYESKKIARRELRALFENKKIGVGNRHFVFWVAKAVAFVTDKEMDNAIKEYGSEMLNSYKRFKRP